MSAVRIFRRSRGRSKRAGGLQPPFFQSMPGESEYVAGGEAFFAAAPTSVQTRLTIGEPGDKYEQEADAMADRVVGMSPATVAGPTTSPTIQTMCEDCAGEKEVQRMAEKEEDPKLQKQEKEEDPKLQKQEKEEDLKLQKQEKEKEKPTVRTQSVMRKAADGSSVGTPALSAQLSNSKGGGSPLPLQTHAQMGSAFGRDFSSVRIHTGSYAVQMNEGLHARAFTYGNDIYFNRGQYEPESVAGKHLLAHELTHVVQQNQEINRKLDLKDPTPVESDPIPLALAERPIGSTTASFNGALLPKNAAESSLVGGGKIIGGALFPTGYKFERSSDGKAFTAKVDPTTYSVTVSAEMNTITPGTNGVWSGRYPKTMLKKDIPNCSKVETLTVEMSGFKTLYSTVITHEKEHWADIKKLTNSELKPIHDLMLGTVGTGPTMKLAADNWNAKIEKKAANGILSFLKKLVAANQVYDKPGTGTHFTKTKIRDTDDCAKLTIKPN